MKFSTTNNVTLSSNPLNSEYSKRGFADALKDLLQEFQDTPCHNQRLDSIAMGSFAYIKLSCLAHGTEPELEPMLPFGAITSSLDPLLPINCIEARTRAGKVLKRFYCE